MLVQYGGLHYLMLLAQGCPVDNNTSPLPTTAERLQTMAIETLLFLARSFQQQTSSRKRCHSHGGSDAQSPTLKRLRRESINVPCHQSTPSSLQGLVEEPTSAAVSPKNLPGSVCRYRDSDHCPFDLCVKITNGSKVYRYQVHRQTLAKASEVFAVMLSGGYQESLSNEVTLQQVSPEAFETVLHHVYSCPWRGSGCGHRGRGHVVEEMSACEDDRLVKIYKQHKELEEGLIEGITSCLPSDVERERISHTLQVLALANRYFVPSLLSACEWEVLGCVSFDSLVPVFLYSQLHQSRALAHACVKRLVDMPRCQLQVDVFKDLVESADREVFLALIVELFQF